MSTTETNSPFSSPLSPLNDPKMPPTASSESPNPLNSHDQTSTLTPPPCQNDTAAEQDLPLEDEEAPDAEAAPEEPTDWDALEAAVAAGTMGYDIRGDEIRAPTADEYVDDTGRIAPRFHKLLQQPKRKRSLSKLETVRDIQKEMARLYADHHHGRVSASAFTRSAYVLDCLSRITRLVDRKEA